jgi:predicted dehydrogenase
MSSRLKVGIVGLGKMGRIRMREMARRDDVVVTIGADPSPDAHPFFETEGVECVSDPQRVIESNVDAVFVCTPNKHTASICCQALDHGKHVFTEKPPGRTVEDVVSIMEAESRNPGLVLKFGFNHRYHAGIQEAQRIITGGRLGEVLWARGVYGKSGGDGFEAEWRSDADASGGGILLDQGIHMLDLFRFFLGDFPEIKSMVTTAHWNIPVEDNAFALLRDERGRIAMLHSSSTQWKHRFNLELYAAEGYLSVNGILTSTRSYGDETITIARRRHSGAQAVGKPREEVIYFDTDPSWELELDEFIDAVRGRGVIQHGTSQDALAAMKLVFDIYAADPTFRGARRREAPRLQALPGARGSA